MISMKIVVFFMSTMAKNNKKYNNHKPECGVGDAAKAFHLGNGYSLKKSNKLAEENYECDCYLFEEDGEIMTAFRAFMKGIGNENFK